MTGRPSTLKPDDALFARAAAGESMRMVAPSCGVDVSNLSRFFRDAGELAAARLRAAHGGTEPLPIPVELPPVRSGESGFLDLDAERAARVGRAPGRPASSFLAPEEWLEHREKLARVDGKGERLEEIGRACAEWEAGLGRTR